MAEFDETKSNWKRLLEEQHNVSIDGDESISLLTGPPASGESLDLLEKKFGVDFPDEFRSFYSQHNGYGQTYERDGSVEKDWLILPMERMTTFDTLSDWKTEAHREAAKKLLVIIDFGTGDVAGYKLNESGGIISSELHVFSHERIDFDPNQNPQEFIFQYWDGIAHFLADEWAY